MSKRYKKDKDQLRLLTHDDTTRLPKFKRKARLKKADRELVSRPDAIKALGEFFDNRIFDDLLTVEELAVIFGLAPQTIRNWVALRKIPYVKIGRRRFFQKRSMQEWLNQKEEPQWQ